jgi:Metallopeptidase family M24
LATMLPADWLSARRRTILVFHDPGGGQPIERLAVARYKIGDFFESAWDKDKQPDQWRQLVDVVRERNPKKIALNISPTFALAAGLSAAEFNIFQSVLKFDLRTKIVSAEPLAIGWLETRTDPEMVVYPHIVSMAHEIIAHALSNQVIQPGATTTKDVEWWCRERIAELKLQTWFHPSVSVQRQEEQASFVDLFENQNDVIQPGDLVHIDFGITYLGLSTDTQQMAYVLQPGETEPPAGLIKAFRAGNELQNILTAQFVTGRSGNEILRAALQKARKKRIDATIYTHPIGYHGHGAGPTIGMWDQQQGVEGGGDYPLFANTAYSIELNARVAIPEWGGQKVRIMLEEDAFFDGQRVRYIDGRQTTLKTIP